jgi:hypothetical protein
MYGAINLNGAGSRRSTDEERTGLPKITEGLHHKQPRNSAERQSFSCIQDILLHYERNAPDRPAILARGRPPMTFGGLWIQANDIIRLLRGIGLDRSDRNMTSALNRSIGLHFVDRLTRDAVRPAVPASCSSKLAHR